MRKLLRRIGYLWNRPRRARDLAEEMAAHRAQLSQDRARSFGPDLRLREEARDVWGFLWLDQLWQDLAYGARQLRRAPVFAATAVAILALGSGLNLAAFQLFEATYFYRPALRDAESLLEFWRQSPSRTSNYFPYEAVAFYRDNNVVLSYLVSETPGGEVAIDDDDVAAATFVAGNYFADLGITPHQGRLLDPRDDRAGAAPVAALGYRYWQAHFGGDPAVIGRTLRVNGKAVQVAGVTPAEFDGLEPRGTALWLPASTRPYFIDDAPPPGDLSRSDSTMYATLRPGVSLAAAESQLRALTAELRKRQPDAIQPDESPRGRSFTQARAELGRRQPVALLSALVFLILLSACANLGNILLARGLARGREIRTRVAVGAGRARVLRQLMTENLLLATLGCAAGLPIGYLGAKLFLYFSTDAPADLRIAFDARTILASAVLAVLCAALFGLGPAFASLRPTAGKARARRLLIAVQVAASCVLLILTTLLARNAQRVLALNIPFDYRHMLVLRPNLRPGVSSRSIVDQAARARIEQAAAAVERVPGVASVAIASRIPFQGWSIYTPPDLPPLFVNYVAPSYFDTMTLPLLRGRAFAPGDTNAIVVSESAARVLWPRQDALGQVAPYEFDGKRAVVIGVVRDSEVSSVQDETAVEAYLPLSYRPYSQAALIVRTAGDPRAWYRGARPQLDRLRIARSFTLISDALERRVSQIRSLTSIVAALSAVATLLAAAGIFGLVAFAVVQRTREIGVRMALGARRVHVLRVLTGQYAVPVAAGIAAGIALAVVSARFINRQFFGIQPVEPVSYAAGLALFALVAFLAVCLPARRALRIDPARALHWE